MKARLQKSPMHYVVTLHLAYSNLKSRFITWEIPSSQSITLCYVSNMPVLTVSNSNMEFTAITQALKVVTTMEFTGPNQPGDRLYNHCVHGQVEKC